MRQHIHTLTVKDDTTVSYGMTRFDDLRPDWHGGGSWLLTMFGVQIDKFSFIAVQFELVKSHPVHDVHYTEWNEMLCVRRMSSKGDVYRR